MAQLFSLINASSSRNIHETVTKSNRGKLFDAFLAIGVGIGILVFGALTWLTVGILTHVVGICSGASPIWTQFYGFILLLIPAVAVFGAIFSYFGLRRDRQRPKDLTKSL